MKNVALFGNMASGKSLIAQMLVDNGYARLSFADPLKNTAELAYGPINKSDPYLLMDIDGTGKVHSGREILQELGQTVKLLDRDFWLKCLLRTAKNYGDIPLVVDDGRFFFERDALRLRGWLIVGVDTPREVRMERYLKTYGRYPTVEEMAHASEREIPDIVAQADIIVDGTSEPSTSLVKILEKANEANGPRTTE